MNEANFTYEELMMIKHILRLHHSPAAKKIVQKINVLLEEPEDEGGWVVVEPLKGK